MRENKVQQLKHILATKMSRDSPVVFILDGETTTFRIKHLWVKQDVTEGDNPKPVGPAKLTVVLEPVPDGRTVGSERSPDPDHSGTTHSPTNDVPEKVARISIESDRSKASGMKESDG
jgi:hypothetical protein